MPPFLKTKNSICRLIKTYYIALIPLIIYGVYKNGIIPYYNKVIPFYAIFKPILIALIGFICGLILELIYQKTYKFTQINIMESFTILNGLIISLMVPINMNILILIIILIPSLLICKLLKKIFNINEITIIFIIIILALQLFNIGSFKNIYEANNVLVLTFTDYLFGRSIGGVGVTNNIAIIVGYLILCTNKAYKKQIPIYIFLFYTILTSIYLLLVPTNNMLPILFNGFIFYGLVFIAADSFSSSYTKKGQISYSVIIATITFILTTIFKIYYGIFIAIIIANLLNRICDKIYLKL